MKTKLSENPYLWVLQRWLAVGSVHDIFCSDFFVIYRVYVRSFMFQVTCQILRTGIWFLGVIASGQKMFFVSGFNRIRICQWVLLHGMKMLEHTLGVYHDFALLFIGYNLIFVLPCFFMWLNQYSISLLIWIQQEGRCTVIHSY